MMSTPLLCCAYVMAEFVLWLLTLVEELAPVAIVSIKEFLRKSEAEITAMNACEAPSIDLQPDILARTVTTQSVVPPAETQQIADSSSITNVSTNNVETVGSAKQILMNVFNKMLERNLQTKCEEIKALIVETEEKCIPWLARYIVKKLITNEQNRNKIRLYSSCLTSLNNIKLTDLVTIETEAEIKLLLDEDRLSPVCRKTMLQNLGNWYGIITLAKNKPIGTAFNDLKSLLIQSYQEDKLMYALSFITRILATCTKSRVFNTASPWTLDILHCLSDLHRQPNLKLTFKIQIETLCKIMKIKLEELKPTVNYFIQSRVKNGFQT